MNAHFFTRIAVGLSSVVAITLLPGSPVQAAEPVHAVALVKHRPHHCHRAVEPWTAPVRRCTKGYPAAKRVALLTYPGVWAPQFEPSLNGIGRTGAFFAYVGRTPAGWVQLDAALGGTLTLTDEYGTYVKGTQRIALYDPRGRLVAWDWITLDWDW